MGDLEVFWRQRFDLWKVNIQDTLIQQKCIEERKGEALMPALLTQVEKIEIMGNVKNAIILFLRDKFLREVSKEKNATYMWEKLELLYITKCLAHRLCRK